MNRREAVQHLHDRHPHVIHAPEADVDLGALHLEVFWFQGHVCELIEDRADQALRRCFATIDAMLRAGDRDVRVAICDHFVMPHLVFEPSLEWAKARMSSLLADLCTLVKKSIDAEFPSGAAGSSGS